MQKSRLNSRKKTNLKAILLGICLALILHLVLSLPAAAIINVMKNPLSAVGIAGITTHLLCGIITAFAICKYKAEGAVISCFFSSLLFFVIALPVGMLTTDGSIPLHSLINNALYVAECTAFAPLFKWIKNKRH